MIGNILCLLNSSLFFNIPSGQRKSELSMFDQFILLK